MDTAALQLLLDLGATQHGVFSTAQAGACGVSDDAVRAWARSGRLVRIRRGIWSVTGVPTTSERIAQAALLSHGHGAALCRTSAGWCWELPGHPLEPVCVIRARDEHRRNVGSSHTSRALDATDLTQRRGLAVTTPTRTIFDLAGTQPPERTRRDLNGLMGRGLISLDLLDEGLDRLATRGRRGITTMRALIAEAHEVGAPAGSNLELTVETMLRLAGLGTMRRQLEIFDVDGLVARVDFGEPDLRIVVEVDSDRFHHGLLDRQLDARKTARLDALGWTVFRIAESEVWHARTAVVNRLRRAAWEARSRLAA